MKKMNGIMKMFKTHKELISLMKGVREKIEDDEKEQRGLFFLACYQLNQVLVYW